VPRAVEKSRVNHLGSYTQSTEPKRGYKMPAGIVHNVEILRVFSNWFRGHFHSGGWIPANHFAASQHRTRLFGVYTPLHRGDKHRREHREHSYQACNYDLPPPRSNGAKESIASCYRWYYPAVGSERGSNSAHCYRWKISQLSEHNRALGGPDGENKCRHIKRVGQYVEMPPSNVWIEKKSGRRQQANSRSSEPTTYIM
jgi:hypothetical protein